jgi:FlaA1/EpsC-like NDP-sugar epimerase
MKSFLRKKLLDINVPRWVVLFIDLYIVANTFVLAYLIRFNFKFNFDVSKLEIQLPIVLIIALLSFLAIGSYKGIIKHTGYRDAIKIIKSSTLLFVILGILVLVNRSTPFSESFTIPLSILMIHYLLNIVVLIASRYIYKTSYHLIISDIKTQNNVLIYGAGQSGLITYSVLINDVQGKVKIVGFIDDDKGKWKKVINGVPILNPQIVDQEFIEKKNIDEIIISIQMITSSKLIEIVEQFADFPVKVKIVPPVENWINNNLNANQIKSIKIEDLLGRRPIKLNNPNLEKEFEGKTILITGAAGSIGSEIARQLVSFNCHHLILLDQSESDLYNLQQYFWNKGITNFTAIVGDIRNINRMESVFKTYTPEIVFHAAAYKHVPFMEEYVYESVCVNIEGTKNIADMAMQFNVEKFVMISTDKAVNPTNVMGASKRISEMYINGLNTQSTTKFITTRFGNVLGSNGSVIPLFKQQIENGGPLTVTHKEVTRFFMTIPEACQLVLEAGVMGQGGEIFVFDMGKSIKIINLALNMIRLSGLKYPDDIDIEITGLRPGEKIYEEVLGAGENTLTTYHPKIKIAQVKPLHAESVIKKIRELCRYNAVDNLQETVLKMKEIVPEYISNNSIFEALDTTKKIKQ